MMSRFLPDSIIQQITRYKWENHNLLVPLTDILHGLNGAKCGSLGSSSFISSSLLPVDLND